MSPAAPIEPTKKTLPESSSSGEVSPERADLENHRRFGHLRGVQWRIDLGILPSSSSSSVDDIRRVTANCRRRYAALRRRLLINPHISKDENNLRDLVMDNPLSQNPDSKWGRFFHKAELERMVDQDLSRLYPEHGSYFQTPGCQGVLRRILLLWCIRHPNYGYRQGMHELLAPLLYVLESDLERLSEVRKKYQDYFTDNFDGLSFTETDSTYKSDLDKDSPDKKDQLKHNNYLNDLDPKVQTIISFSDAYGAEGELGIVLSEKFMEHDAYSMFDALMNGDGGAVAMANFFSHSPYGGPQHGGLPPVIEASSALYHLLSIVDLSLYSHLVQLGVEPQYFALRWLRVLFGREFALEDLLVIWDEIFALDNSKLSENYENETEVSFGVLKSTRGAFISALAVSMILYLRSSLLATENATSCLQRLLNFPEDVNLVKLIKKAKSLMTLATDAINSISDSGGVIGSPRSLVPENYWEEKWRVMNKEEEEKKQPHKQVQNRFKGWSEKVKMRLSRTESARLLSKASQKMIEKTKSPVRRNLTEDLTHKLGAEDNSNVFFDPISPSGFVNNINTNNNTSNNNDNDNDNDNDNGNNNNDGDKGRSGAKLFIASEEVGSPLPISDRPEDMSIKELQNENNTEKIGNNLQERRPLSGKLQWLWMFAKPGPTEGSSSVIEHDEKNAVASTSGLEVGDDKNTCSLKILAQSMIQNIEVIESVLEQEKGETDHVAMEALKELRKISNILTEM